MVVDKQQRARALHRLHGGLHLLRDGGCVVGLEAQLHRGHTGTGHTAHPWGIGQHGVQAQLLRAGDKGVHMRHGLQAKVARVIRPVGGIEIPCAQGLRLPGAGQA